MPPQLSTADYVVIAFYFVFMTAMAWAFKRFIRNTSDYFRGGGEMLWWIAGAGAFMVSFSAVTFTGMAGKAYVDGPVVLVIFVGNALGFLINYLWFAPVSRQTRAITAMQVVRQRFDRVNEQLFTWLQIPVGTFYAGVWLMGLGVFVSAAFGMPMNTTIVVTGLVVLVMALVGGSWSVMAGDFVQMLILMPVTIVAAVLALVRVGGPARLIEDAPAHFWRWSEAGSGSIIALWVAATLLQKFVSTNSMQDCSRYLSVKDSAHARRAALLGMALFVLGPVLWFIPPMAARIVHPDIASMFPNLTRNPQEASYFAMAVTTLPAGMVGLLLSGIFGATMSSMDGGLNKNAGFFVKNFYQLHVRPQATERELLVASKATTLVLGLLILGAGLLFANWKELTIFELMTYFGGLVALPVSVPLVLGLFVRRAPAWAGWSSVLVGLGASLATSIYLSAPEAQRLLGVTFNARESSDWRFLIGVFINLLAGGGWFMLSCLFASRRPAAEVARVERFFQQATTPVDFHAEHGEGSDNLQARIMGNLCLIYGGFVTVLALLPNAWTGRLAFVFCGGCMAGIGAALRRAGSRAARPTPQPAPVPAAEAP